MPRKVAIFIFDEVEVLDFAGPFEVFAVTGARVQPQPFEVFTVGRTHDPIAARNGLSVNPAYAFSDCPQPDILLIPGGYGTRPLMEDRFVLDWIRAAQQKAELLLSVCTGSLLLGRAGLLDGLQATTHDLAMAELRKAAPGATVHEDRRVVDNGRVVTSAGVASGIDMSFHIVARLLGQDTAAAMARYIEYPWPRANG